MKDGRKESRKERENRRENANKSRRVGRGKERTDELMDYKLLVPNVSGVFALLSLRWKNLLNQSEAFCPHSGPPVMISVISSHAGTFVASGKSHLFPPHFPPCPPSTVATRQN